MALSTRRVAAAALAAVMWIGCARAADVLPVRQGLQVEDLGTPVKSRSATITRLIRAKADGHWHLLAALEAFSGMGNDPPFLIYDLDLDAGRARIVEGTVGRPGHPYRHSSGKVYFGQSRPPCLLEYDLETGATRLCGSLKGSYLWSVGPSAEDAEGRVYAGCYGQHVCHYDPKSGEFRDFGAMGNDKSYGYVYSLALDDKYVYCGMAVKGKWYPIVLDPATGKWTEFLKPDDPRQSTTAHVVRYADGSVGFGRKYLFEDGKPVEVDPKVLRAKKPRPGDPDSVALTDADKIGLEIDTDGMQPTGWNDGEVIVKWRAVDPATGKAAEGTPWREARTTGADVRPNCVKRLAPMPDGRFIGMSAFYGNIFTFDPAARESKPLGPAPFSIYDIVVDGPMVYFCGYPTSFAVYDTRKPWTFSKKNELRDPDQNPYVLQRGGKYNYQMARGADGRVYICGTHVRHDSGASLNWYDPEKPREITHLRKGFEDHQPSDLVALDGGRLIVMGYGAQLVVFDTTTHEVTKRIDLPAEAGAAGKLLAVDPDKVLSLRQTTVKDKDGKGRDAGLLCLVNVVGGAVEYVKTLDHHVFCGMTSMDLKPEDSRLCAGPDGCGWLFVDDALSRIKPADGTVETIMPMKERGRMFFVGDDLYIYNGGRQFFNGFADVLRIKGVFQR